MTFRRSPAAFSLIELTIAIGIAAFCLISIFALLPQGLITNRNSIDNTIGAGLALGIAADLRAVPAGSTDSSPLYKLDPTKYGALPELYLNEDGSKQTKPDAGYVAKITLTQPKTSPLDATSVFIQILKPPTAAKPTVVFEAVTAIDRN